MSKLKKEKRLRTRKRRPTDIRISTFISPLYVKNAVQAEGGEENVLDFK